MKYLVVVESPSKAKTIQKYLGKDYEVKASKGHIVDLPKSEIGVDVDNKYNPKYVVTKRKALTDLKKAFEGKDGLVLAVDPDREGEAIGWHIANKLGLITNSGNIKKGANLQRIVFTSITKDAVQDAIKNPREIDMNLFNAQQARRVLDRLVGYKLSPLLWKKIRFGLSAGRVQSVAVRLIVEREEEREKFVSKEYWSVSADLSEKSGSKSPIIEINEKADESQKDKSSEYITFDLVKYQKSKPEIGDKKSAEEIVNKLIKGEWRVSSIEKRGKT